MVNNHLPVFMILVVLQTTAGSITLAPPGRVWFNSTNLHNVVEWRPSGEKAQYSVEYAIYGDEDKLLGGQVRWRQVKHCTQVRQSFCDLSDQTHNLTEEYYARVRAVDTSDGVASDWVMTPRFHPLTDTVLGAPQLIVHVDGNALNIKVKGPMRWRTRHMKKEHSMRSVFPRLYYNISLYENTTGQMRQIITENKSHRVGSLEYDSLYCIAVEASSQRIPVHSRPSQRHCETTPPDPFKAHMLVVILGGLLPSAISLFVLTLAGCLVYHYVFGNKQRQPNCVTIPPRDEPLLPKVAIVDADLNIDLPSTKLIQKIPLNPQQPRSKAPDVQPPHPAVPQPPSGGIGSQKHVYTTPIEAPPGYNSQSWQSSRGPNDHVHSGIKGSENEEEMPPDYGFVAHQPTQEAIGRVFTPPLVQSEPPVMPAPGSDPYRAQRNTNIEGSESEEEMPPDYGFVAHQPTQEAMGRVLPLPLIQSEPPVMPAPGSDPYRAQSNVRPWQASHQAARQELRHSVDDDLTIVVDWNPSTGVLRIPELSPTSALGGRSEAERQEAKQQEEEKKEGGTTSRDLFSSVMVRQPSQDSCEHEDRLSRMETTWQLQVSMDE